MNLDAVYHYLSFLTPPAPQTMFSGIEKMPAATRMVVDDAGGVRTERYWDPLTSGVSLERLGDDDVATAVLEELRAAVRYRKVSDVPVGAFLSGGLYST